MITIIVGVIRDCANAEKMHRQQFKIVPDIKRISVTIKGWLHGTKSTEQ